MLVSAGQYVAQKLDFFAWKYEKRVFLNMRACYKTNFQSDYSQPEIRYNQEAVNHCETAGGDRYGL